VPRPTRKSSRAEIAPWELALIRTVALRFRTGDRDELQAELARRLLVLKTRPPPGIRSWKAYLAKFLFNKASNWVRDQRVREKNLLALDPLPQATSHPTDPEFTLLHTLGTFDPDSDLRLALAQVWKELDPELRALWKLLLEEGGNQLRVARQLGKHRNTVRLWIRKIRKTLRHHGFPELDT
jgi:RNA polymerase sigma factor (sigma-70 family)